MAINFKKSTHTVTVDNSSITNNTIYDALKEDTTGSGTTKYIPFEKTSVNGETKYSIHVKELVETNTSTILYDKSTGTLTCNEIIEK